MDPKVHFISGLPRSGSTLLSAILSQNPKFAASVTSPTAALWGAIIPRINGGSEFAAFFDNAKRSDVLKGVFRGFYTSQWESEVIFDTNRSWTSRAALLAAIYPNSKIICCVRPVGLIINSIERMLRSNPLQTSRVFEFKSGGTVYSRVDTLMDSERGLVGLPWSALREAWFSQNADRLILVNYESLARRPAHVVRQLYEALGEPLYDHDFDHVLFDQSEYDADLGMPGLHKVKEKVEYVSPDICIPPDILASYADANFWLKPELNIRKIPIL